MKKIVATAESPKAIGSYSQAVIANGFFYTSGQVAMDPAGNLMIETIEEETHQVMKNLKAIIIAAGADFSCLVKVTIFLKNMSDFLIVNNIYASYFDDENYPARETIQVAQLPKNVNVEISAIGIIKP